MPVEGLCFALLCDPNVVPDCLIVGPQAENVTAQGALDKIR
jgi:hypothetical protein